MKNIFTIIIFSFLSITLQAQNKAILKPNGELIHVKGSLQDAIRMKGDARFVQPISSSMYSTLGTIDTLGYNEFFVSPGINFGMASQDYLAQYFVVPTEMTALAVGFLPLEWNGNFGNGNPFAEVKIVKCNWTAEEFESYGTNLVGYYPADGNLPNPITPFQDDPGRTGDWISYSDSFVTPPFGEDIWSDEGYGIPIPVEDNVWSWVDLSVIETLEFNSWDVFAVVVKNATEYNEEDYSTSNWGCYSDEEAPAAGLKFYAGGRLNAGDYGWWIRPGYTWDFKVAVNFLGDLPPEISNVTPLTTTLSTEDREVSATITDTNPSGGDSGVSEAYLHYSFNDGEFNQVPMTSTENIYTAYIPGQPLGIRITYFVSAVDVLGNESQSLTYYYYLFSPSNDNLLVFNGYDEPTGYPQSYYFGIDDFENYEVADWDHDVWSYGELTPELLSYYDNVIEITTDGPTDINNEVIRAWLFENADRNYMLAGDEWLGSQTTWDNEYFPGDFQYDILGIDYHHGDLVWSSLDSSYLIAVEGSTLGDALFGKQQEIPGADSLFYNPNYEISISNWLDGVDFLPDVDVFMQTVFEDSIYNVAGSRELDAGNKIAFFAYDPLSINSAPDYYWFGFSASAPQVEALRWFGIDVVTTTKIETEEIVNQFSLSQNYPNPFNPSTTIEYIIPNSVGDENFRPLRMVKLKVFDVLGREIKTLINKPMQPGKYKVEFDASELSSGVYFYTLRSGEIRKTMKFILLK